MQIAKKNQTEEKNTSNLIQIIKGSVISIILSVITLLIASAIFTATNISEATIPVIIIIISAISILLGSIASTKHIRKNGIINGGCVGAIYIIVLYITSSVMISGFNLNLKSLIMLIASILAGVIGRNYRSKCKQKIKRSVLRGKDIIKNEKTKNSINSSNSNFIIINFIWRSLLQKQK